MSFIYPPHTSREGGALAGETHTVSEAHIFSSYQDERTELSLCPRHDKDQEEEEEDHPIWDEEGASILAPERATHRIISSTGSPWRGDEVWTQPPPLGSRRTITRDHAPWDCRPPSGTSFLSPMLPPLGASHPSSSSSPATPGGQPSSFASRQTRSRDADGAHRPPHPPLMEQKEYLSTSSSSSLPFTSLSIVQLLLALPVSFHGTSPTSRCFPPLLHWHTASPLEWESVAILESSGVHEGAEGRPRRTPCHVRDDTRSTFMSPAYRDRVLQTFFDLSLSHHIAVRPKYYLRHGLRMLLQHTLHELGQRSGASAVLFDMLVQKVLHPVRHQEEATEKNPDRHSSSWARGMTGLSSHEQGEEDDEEDDVTMTLGEKLLYVILRTSVMANTAPLRASLSSSLLTSFPSPRGTSAAFLPTPSSPFPLPPSFSSSCSFFSASFPPKAEEEEQHVKTSDTIASSHPRGEWEVPPPCVEEPSHVSQDAAVSCLRPACRGAPGEWRSKTMEPPRRKTCPRNISNHHRRTWETVEEEDWGDRWRPSSMVTPLAESVPTQGRVWLSTATTALLEHSATFQRQLRWSNVVDPVVHAKLIPYSFTYSNTTAPQLLLSHTSHFTPPLTSMSSFLSPWQKGRQTRVESSAPAAARGRSRHGHFGLLHEEEGRRRDGAVDNAAVLQQQWIQSLFCPLSAVHHATTPFTSSSLVSTKTSGTPLPCLAVDSFFSQVTAASPPEEEDSSRYPRALPVGSPASLAAPSLRPPSSSLAMETAMGDTHQFLFLRSASSLSSLVGQRSHSLEVFHEDHGLLCGNSTPVSRLFTSVDSDTLAALFLVLHRCVIGVADPFGITEVCPAGEVVGTEAEEAAWEGMVSGVVSLMSTSFPCSRRIRKDVPGAGGVQRETCRERPPRQVCPSEEEGEHTSTGMEKTRKGHLAPWIRVVPHPAWQCSREGSTARKKGRGSTRHTPSKRNATGTTTTRQALEVDGPKGAIDHQVEQHHHQDHTFPQGATPALKEGPATSVTPLVPPHPRRRDPFPSEKTTNDDATNARSNGLAGSVKEEEDGAWVVIRESLRDHPASALAGSPEREQRKDGAHPTVRHHPTHRRSPHQHRHTSCKERTHSTPSSGSSLEVDCALTSPTARGRKERDRAGRGIPVSSFAFASSSHSLTRQYIFSCGLLSLIDEACSYGTLMLRLQQLCTLADRPEWHAALGSYGRAALHALRQSLSMLRRQAVDAVLRAQDPSTPCTSRPRAGAMHFAPSLTTWTSVQLFTAWEALQPLKEGIHFLAALLGVTTQENWEPQHSLTTRLSSGTSMLSLLYAQVIERAERPTYTKARPMHWTWQKGLTNGPSRLEEAMRWGGTSWERRPTPSRVRSPSQEDRLGEGSSSKMTNSVPAVEESSGTRTTGASFDVLGYFFRTVYEPFQRMLTAWLTRGVLEDPLDEFFIIPTPKSSVTSSTSFPFASVFRLPTETPPAVEKKKGMEQDATHAMDDSEEETGCRANEGAQDAMPSSHVFLEGGGLRKRSRETGTTSAVPVADVNEAMDEISHHHDPMKWQQKGRRKTESTTTTMREENFPFRLHLSPQRLPTFVTPEVAYTILHAGLSWRALHEACTPIVERTSRRGYKSPPPRAFPVAVERGTTPCPPSTTPFGSGAMPHSAAASEEEGPATRAVSPAAIGRDAVGLISVEAARVSHVASWYASEDFRRAVERFRDAVRGRCAVCWPRLGWPHRISDGRKRPIDESPDEENQRPKPPQVEDTRQAGLLPPSLPYSTRSRTRSGLPNAVLHSAGTVASGLSGSLSSSFRSSMERHPTSCGGVWHASRDGGHRSRPSPPRPVPFPLPSSNLFLPTEERRGVSMLDSTEDVCRSSLSYWKRFYQQCDELLAPPGHGGAVRRASSPRRRGRRRKEESGEHKKKEEGKDHPTRADDVGLVVDVCSSSSSFGSAGTSSTCSYHSHPSTPFHRRPRRRGEGRDASVLSPGSTSAVFLSSLSSSSSLSEGGEEGGGGGERVGLESREESLPDQLSGTTRGPSVSSHLTIVMSSSSCSEWDPSGEEEPKRLAHAATSSFFPPPPQEHSNASAHRHSGTPLTKERETTEEKDLEPLQKHLQQKNDAAGEKNEEEGKERARHQVLHSPYVPDTKVPTSTEEDAVGHSTEVMEDVKKITASLVHQKIEEEEDEEEVQDYWDPSHHRCSHIPPAEEESDEGLRKMVLQKRNSAHPFVTSREEQEALMEAVRKREASEQKAMEEVGSSTYMEQCATRVGWAWTQWWRRHLPPGQRDPRRRRRTPPWIAFSPFPSSTGRTRHTVCERDGASTRDREQKKEKEDNTMGLHQGPDTLLQASDGRFLAPSEASCVENPSIFSLPLQRCCHSSSAAVEVAPCSTQQPLFSPHWEKDLLETCWAYQAQRSRMGLVKGVVPWDADGNRTRQDDGTIPQENDKGEETSLSSWPSSGGSSFFTWDTTPEASVLDTIRRLPMPNVPDLPLLASPSTLEMATAPSCEVSMAPLLPVYVEQLARWCGWYSTHKAAQLLWLPPQGWLRVWLGQVVHIVLFQRGTVASRVLEWWRTMCERFTPTTAGNTDGEDRFDVHSLPGRGEEREKWAPIVDGRVLVQSFGEVWQEAWRELPDAALFSLDTCHSPDVASPLRESVLPSSRPHRGPLWWNVQIIPTATCSASTTLPPSHYTDPFSFLHDVSVTVMEEEEEEGEESSYGTWGSSEVAAPSVGGSFFWWLPRKALWCSTLSAVLRSLLLCKAMDQWLSSTWRLGRQRRKGWKGTKEEEESLREAHAFCFCARQVFWCVQAHVWEGVQEATHALYHTLSEVLQDPSTVSFPSPRNPMTGVRYGAFSSMEEISMLLYRYLSLCRFTVFLTPSFGTVRALWNRIQQPVRVVVQCLQEHMIRQLATDPRGGRGEPLAPHNLKEKKRLATVRVGRKGTPHAQKVLTDRTREVVQTQWKRFSKDLHALIQALKKVSHGGGAIDEEDERFTFSQDVNSMRCTGPKPSRDGMERRGRTTTTTSIIGEVPSPASSSAERSSSFFCGADGPRPGRRPCCFYLKKDADCYSSLDALITKLEHLE